MKSSGYKGMLRDRCPYVVNCALKWQKAKEKWIDHTYTNFVRIYVKKDDKDHAARIILGIAKYYKNFDFHKSIDWDNLEDDEKIYWQRVESWVDWFRSKYAYMENTYKISNDAGKSEFDISVELIQRYLAVLLPQEQEDEETKQAKYQYVDNLVKFLIKCFKHEI